MKKTRGKKKSKKLRSHGPDRLSCSLRRSFITFLDKVKPMVFHVSPTDGFYSYRACYIDPRMPVANALTLLVSMRLARKLFVLCLWGSHTPASSIRLLLRAFFLLAAYHNKLAPSNGTELTDITDSLARHFFFETSFITYIVSSTRAIILMN